MSTQSAQKHANPAPLGLIGFGMTTVLLNIHNAGITELSVVILAMGIALGGLAQIIAGIMEFKSANTFGATAFTAYGCFWWSLVLIWVFPTATTGIAAADDVSMGFYLLLWGIFTLFMFVGTLQGGFALKVVFGSLTLLFFLLALEHFLLSHAIGTLAGYVGIFCGCSAIYTAAGEVLNEKYGKTVLPI